MASVIVAVLDGWPATVIWVRIVVHSFPKAQCSSSLCHVVHESFQSHSRQLSLNWLVPMSADLDACLFRFSPTGAILPCSFKPLLFEGVHFRCVKSIYTPH